MIIFDIFTPLSPPSLILSSPWGKQHRQPVQMDGLLTMLCVCCLRDDVQLDSVCVRDLTEANRMGRGQHTHYVSVHWQLSACGSETRDVKQRYCITLADAVFFFLESFCWWQKSTFCLFTLCCIPLIAVLLVISLNQRKETFFIYTWKRAAVCAACAHAWSDNLCTCAAGVKMAAKVVARCLSWPTQLTVEKSPRDDPVIRFHNYSFLAEKRVFLSRHLMA